MAKSHIRIDIDQVGHYTPAERAAIIASYPAHEREARTRGLPVLGSGLVYPLLDDAIQCAPFALPRDWPRIIGLDFGYEHPFAAVDLAWNKDADVIYVVAAHREQHQTPIVHAATVKQWGAWIPCAWPHDGLAHDKGSAAPLATLYAQQGLNMLPEHATHEEGGNGVEAGVTEMLDRMKTGRFKVFANLTEWLAEKRGYHRKSGLIVKRNDDLMDATRTAVMMRRFAATEPRKMSFGPPAAGGWLG
jgi:hypothetical protein